MPRRRRYGPLAVFFNNRLVGHLHKESAGSIRFDYELEWLAWEHAVPVSLSMPLREQGYSGAVASAVFENLLPDNEAVRRAVASRFGADGTDPFSLLGAIGRDCVGALQFLAESEQPDPPDRLAGVVLSDEDIADRLSALSRNPLGLRRDDDMRISIAGAQEKTAFLKKASQWLSPQGATPTTHIFKTQIGRLSNGLDLTQSVENEYLCLQIVKSFGFPVANTSMEIFGDVKVLVVERFDRKWIDPGRLIRLPQEDCCQALSFPSTLKYQRDGGPGVEEIMTLLQGSDEPDQDRMLFFKAQLLFWLLGATDGHAKNFSVFLFPHGRFRMTPLYDILSLQPSVDSGLVRRNEFRLAMRLGDSKKYKVSDIQGRHLVQTARRCGLSERAIDNACSEIADRTLQVTNDIENALPDDFPAPLLESVVAGIRGRVSRLSSR
jgi:serine/threonine-protein kinase HipA